MEGGREGSIRKNRENVRERGRRRKGKGGGGKRNHINAKLIVYLFISGLSTLSASGILSTCT